MRVTEYYTTTGGVAAKGYPKARWIRNGEDGTPIKLVEYEYENPHTDDGGATVYPVSREIVYPDDADPDKTISTSYAYTYYLGTNQVQQKTTTLPAVPTAQNGSGVANSTVDVFDLYGNRIWRKDERGFITRWKYDIQTKAVTQRIDDVDTSQVSDAPTGWSTPNGGGLHLVTDYEHDRQGRIVQQLGPAHLVDIGGTATAIRRAEWTVYQDAADEIWTAQGWQKMSDSTFTLINPVTIQKYDKHRNLTDEVRGVRGSTSGKLQASDTFAQSSWVRWTSHQYSDCCKLVSSRVYHTIPSSGEGTSGTNYDQTDYGYDLRDRRNRVKTPGGTITSTVFDVRGLPVKIYVGTDDSGATDDDPTGNGDPDNNMVLVTENQYDGGVDGGDGNLTQVTQYVDSQNTRVTTYTLTPSLATLNVPPTSIQSYSDPLASFTRKNLPSDCMAAPIHSAQSRNRITPSQVGPAVDWLGVLSLWPVK